MDRKETEIKKNINDFVRKIKRKINVKKVILFGSRARGDAEENSDVDLIILSDDFKGIPYYKRYPEFYLLWNDSNELDLVLLTPEEFKEKKKQISIIKDAAKYGIIISK